MRDSFLLRRRRGFTLVELMIVVALIGILSALAVFGYRKYIAASKSAEGGAIVQAIKAAEEGFRGETMGYLDASTGNTFYPNAGPVNGSWHAWAQPGHVDYANWRSMSITADQTRFTFWVRAGKAGVPFGGGPLPTGYPASQIPNPPIEPWYVIVAKGDPDQDGDITYFVGSSFTSELYQEGL